MAKITNENPHCGDYDDEGRCNQCAQFNCYECDWGVPFEDCNCRRCEDAREAELEEKRYAEERRSAELEREKAALAAKAKKEKLKAGIDGDLESMTTKQLKEEAKRLRNAIRYHRDQKGDDRCWVDDLRLYETLPEPPTNYDPTLPPEDVFLENCKRFCKSRQTPVGQPFKKDW